MVDDDRKKETKSQAALQREEKKVHRCHEVNCQCIMNCPALLSWRYARPGPCPSNGSPSGLSRTSADFHSLRRVSSLGLAWLGNTSLRPISVTSDGETEVLCRPWAYSRGLDAGLFCQQLPSIRLTPPFSTLTGTIASTSPLQSTRCRCSYKETVPAIHSRLIKL